jgi:hypothetical protein
MPNQQGTASAVLSHPPIAGPAPVPRPRDAVLVPLAVLGRLDRTALRAPGHAVLWLSDALLALTARRGRHAMPRGLGR